MSFLGKIFDAVTHHDAPKETSTCAFSNEVYGDRVNTDRTDKTIEEYKKMGPAAGKQAGDGVANDFGTLSAY